MIAVSADPYCKVYLRGSGAGAASIETMRAAVGEAAGGGRFAHGTLRTDRLLIQLIANTDGRGQTDFIGWPFYLEIDAVQATTSEDFIAAIRAFLSGLGALGVDAVPSCDFEDQLQDVSCPLS